MTKTTMQIEKETLEKLSKFGGFHSTYESIIISLLDHVQNCKLANIKTN